MMEGLSILTSNGQYSNWLSCYCQIFGSTLKGSIDMDDLPTNTWVQPTPAAIRSPKLPTPGPEQWLALHAAAWPLAQSEERRIHAQLASRLHNDLAQLLAIALIHLDEARTGQQPAAFGRGHLLVREAMQSTRALISQLQNVDTATDSPNSDLVTRLQQCIQHMNRIHDIEFEFVCDGQPGALPGDISETLFSSTQELLTNAMKHARSGRIEVRVLARPGRMSITVQNQAPYVPVAPPLSYGQGLPLMRSRLADIGATLRWRSSQRGVQARIRWAGVSA
jgi:signal transduction histidine kinase